MKIYQRNSNFDAIFAPLRMKKLLFFEIAEIVTRSCWDSEMWAVQKKVNVVDLGKVFMLQNETWLAIVAVQPDRERASQNWGDFEWIFNPLR